MNSEHLRRSLKTLWLDYYRNNRHWLDRVGVWVNCEGVRRPSSSFILGMLATAEPRLTQLLPLVVDLSSNPDRIILALGLNFNPDSELRKLETMSAPPKMLPDRTQATSHAVTALNGDQQSEPHPIDSAQLQPHSTPPHQIYSQDRIDVRNQVEPRNQREPNSIDSRQAVVSSPDAQPHQIEIPAIATPRYQRKD